MNVLRHEILTGRQAEVLQAARPLVTDARGVLAGGLGFALRFGHRRSHDVDWFLPADADCRQLAERLAGTKGVALTVAEPGTIHGQWHAVPFSIIRYRYALGSEQLDGWDLADIRTAVGMKVLAVVNRGARRDLIDLACCLSQGRELSTIIAETLADIPGLTVETILRALAYHDDAEVEPDPNGLAADGWQQAKGHLATAIHQYVEGL